MHITGTVVPWIAIECRYRAGNSILLYRYGVGEGQSGTGAPVPEQYGGTRTCSTVAYGSTEVVYRYSLFVSNSVGLGHASEKKPVLECTNDSLNTHVN